VSAGQTLNYTAWLYNIRQEWQAVHGQAEDLIALAHSRDFHSGSLWEWSGEVGHWLRRDKKRKA
jgi:hypothetical protein